MAVILPLAMLNYETYVKPSVTLYLSMLVMHKPSHWFELVNARKHLLQSVFLIDDTSHSPAASPKMTPLHRCFSAFCYCKSMRRFLYISYIQKHRFQTIHENFQTSLEDSVKISELVQKINKRAFVRPPQVMDTRILKVGAFIYAGAI